MNVEGRQRWMTLTEVAEYLQISRSKLYAMAQGREIPCSKIAGQWRFLQQEVDEWMRNQRTADVRGRNHPDRK